MWAFMMSVKFLEGEGVQIKYKVYELTEKLLLAYGR